MAYDPATGQWTDENTSVSKRLQGLLAEGSPYITQADTAALQTANRRGLANSSIAVQAGEAARIGAALPIAQQEASQASQAQLQGRGLQEGAIEQGKSIEAQKGLQTAQIGSTEKLAGQSIEAQTAQQQAAIAAAKEQQATGITAAKEQQATGIASTEKLAGQTIASQEKQQATGIEAQKALQASEQAQQTWLANFDATTRTNLQVLDEQTKAAMQQLDVASQQRIADMNVASDARDSASRLAASLELGYMQSITSIQNNADIPADTRQTYIDHANAVRESNIALIEQMYGITLDWATPTGP